MFICVGFVKNVIIFLFRMRLQIYDPADTGFANVEILADIFCNLGFGKLSDDDIRVP